MGMDLRERTVQLCSFIDVANQVNATNVAAKVGKG